MKENLWGLLDINVFWANRREGHVMFTFWVFGEGVEEGWRRGGGGVGLGD